MQLVVRLRSDQARKARELLDSGLYASYNEFLMVAIDNQLNLEEHGGEASVHDTLQLHRPRSTALPGPAATDGPAVPLADNMPPTSGPIWGQYNRFAPTIVALRTAAEMTDKSSTTWVPIDDYWNEASKAALAVGQKLRDLDIQRGNKRGSRLDTAFPLGKAQEKSLRRFQQQFAGDLAKRADRPIGMAPECRFLQVERHDDEVMVALTEPGRRLAALPFPAIDKQEPTTTLAPEQVAFLLEHITTHLPDETRFARRLLVRIAEGGATLQDLERLARQFDSAWNEDVASTQRGGLVGRLNELGLLAVGRSGLNSTYRITGSGRDALRILNGGYPNA